MTTAGTVQELFGSNDDVLTISVEDNVTHAARKMREYKAGCLVVTDDRNRVMGIITERDILKKIVAESLDPNTTLAGEVMTKRVVSCGIDTPITEAQRLMAENKIRHVLVIENGELLGMISGRDILCYQLSSAESALREQARLLHDLEMQHPGITSVEKDRCGRIVI